MYRRPGITGLTPQSSLCFAKRLTTREVTSHISTLVSVSPDNNADLIARTSSIEKGRSPICPPAVDRSREFSSRSTQVRQSSYSVAALLPCRAETSLRSSAFQPLRVPCQRRTTPLSPQDGCLDTLFHPVSSHSSLGHPPKPRRGDIECPQIVFAAAFFPASTHFARHARRFFP